MGCGRVGSESVYDNAKLNIAVNSFMCVASDTIPQQLWHRISAWYPRYIKKRQESWLDLITGLSISSYFLPAAAKSPLELGIVSKL